MKRSCDSMNNSILKGITVLELNGLAPVQFCGQILSDFGARVIRIDKVQHLQPPEELHGNGKMSVAINLKTPKGIEVLKKLSRRADVLIEPFRAGVMESLGAGADILMKENERLIYTRLSGYGQSGPYAKTAGHDINFLSLSGVLSLFGWRNRAPSPPCNIIGDFGGGSLLCAFGIVMALYERQISGRGQVIDLSIMRGSSYLTSWIFANTSTLWTSPRGQNLLDGGAYMYDTYETKDGKWMAVGALEKKFYDDALKGLGLSEDECPYFSEKGGEIFAARFKEKTQDEWTKIFSELDACVTPVMTVEEASGSRPEDFIRSGTDGSAVPRPEPKFSRSGSQATLTLPKPRHGQHTCQVLREVGYTQDEIHSLNEDNAIYYPNLSKL